jgi:hypothetical protein
MILAIQLQICVEFVLLHILKTAMYSNSFFIGKEIIFELFGPSPYQVTSTNNHTFLKKGLTGG